MTQVLHLDFVSLKNPVDSEQRSRLAEAAAGLMAMEQVVSCGVLDGVAGSDFDLVFFFVLPDFQALEPFGTDPRYVAFLQKHVAPTLKAFSGADVGVDGELKFPGRAIAACIALTAPEETYDFEIREALEGWVRNAGVSLSAVGLAVGELRGYRGVALIFGEGAIGRERPVSDTFRVTYVWGGARLLG